MTFTKLCASAMVLCALNTHLKAGIPEPSVIVYGSVLINGAPPTNVTTLRAYLNDVEISNTLYDSQNSLYGLAIPLETSVVGSPVSSGAAGLGQSIEIRIQQQGGPEAYVTDIQVSRGLISPIDVNASINPWGDIDGDFDVDMTDLDFFVSVLLGLDVDPDHINRSDIDANGNADGLDIKPFVDASLSQ